jgi:hypothetical protein
MDVLLRTEVGTKAGTRWNVRGSKYGSKYGRAPATKPGLILCSQDQSQIP